MGSHIAFVQAKDVVSVQAAAASLFDTAPHFLHDLIRSEIRKTTSKRNYVNVCSSSLSQKLTNTIKSQAVSSTEYYTENWEEKYTTYFTIFKKEVPIVPIAQICVLSCHTGLIGSKSFHNSAFKGYISLKTFGQHFHKSEKIC